MKIALTNWKMLWDEIRLTKPRIPVGELGFETSADSYWTLVKLIVERFEGITAEQQTTDSSSGSQIPDENYSESSMSSSARIDFLPFEADCDSHGAHLRKILRR
jgi:hypothetical protein